MAALPLLLIFSLLSPLSHSATVDFALDGGAVPGDDSEDACWQNGRAMNATLNSLKNGDTFVVAGNQTFHLMGGIIVRNLRGVTLRFDGQIVYSKAIRDWPRGSDGRVLECLQFINATDVLFTSSTPQLGYKSSAEELGVDADDVGGLMDGNGAVWWGIPGIGYLVHGEDRPRLLVLDQCANIKVENLLLKDSPYWTFLASGVAGLEVSHTKIHAARTQLDRHDVVDMTAFNTDGFDVTGRDVWIHDVEVWNQDDTIAVKDSSEDMLFERIVASGVGLTIGSIGNSVVRNITFRDCTM